MSGRLWRWRCAWRTGGSRLVRPREKGLSAALRVWAVCRPTFLDGDEGGCVRVVGVDVRVDRLNRMHRSGWRAQDPRCSPDASRQTSPDGAKAAANHSRIPETHITHAYANLRNTVHSHTVSTYTHPSSHSRNHKCLVAPFCRNEQVISQGSKDESVRIKMCKRPPPQLACIAPPSNGALLEKLPTHPRPHARAHGSAQKACLHGVTFT